MTHEEVLLEIDSLNDSCSVVDILATTLRKIVELHKPEHLDERGDVCLACCPDLLTLYPCPTIKVIIDRIV